MAVLPTVSTAFVPGSFSKALDTSTPGTSDYSFTPEATYNPFFCPNIGSKISVTILSTTAPTFDQIPYICNGDILPVLPTTSKNEIIGTWNPAVIDDTQTTTYTFTSTSGTCSTKRTIELGENTPTFTGANVVPTRVGFNSVTTLGFPTTSDEGYTGVWSLKILNPLINEYTFTSDDLSQCVRSVSFYVTTTYVNPFFIAKGPFCEGATVTLPTQSDDVTPLTGSWSPSTVDTAKLGTTSYLFTPDDTNFSPVSIDFTVNSLPTATSPATGLSLCDDDNDGLVSGFDLTTKSPEVLGSQGSGYHVDYYNGSGILITATATTNYTNINNPETITARVINSTTTCYSETTFSIAVNSLPTATSPATGLSLCDDDNDGLVSGFDLTTKSPEVLGSQGSGYHVDYYNGSGVLITATATTNYTNITNPETITARVTNTNTATNCYRETTFDLEISPSSFSLADSYILCLNTNGTEVLDNPLIIDTGLSDADYDFTWVLTVNSTIVLGTQSSFSPQIGGNYTVTVRDPITGCLATQATEVLESTPPTLTLLVLTPAFASSHSIEATADGETVDGYEYNLDGSPWQDSGLFTNVSEGGHSIFARDKTGCGYVFSTTTVIGYMLYFTPNGDGTNDTWSITDTQGQLSNVKINIFDRYGKFIKQISSTSGGWDGTYKGNPMPTNDYWFTITYTEQSSNAPKVFKAHFTLKR